MSDPKPFGNITVRLEREFLARLEALEEETRLNRSEITRQCLDAVLRQFERTKKLSFPIEIADVPLAQYRQVVERVGELSAMLAVEHKRLALSDHEQFVMAKETDKLRQAYTAVQVENHNLNQTIAMLRTRNEDLEKRLDALEDDDLPGK